MTSHSTQTLQIEHQESLIKNEINKLSVPSDHSSESGLDSYQSPSGKINADESVLKNNSTRQKKKRISQACETCHRRKTRCLGGHPCPTCAKRNLPCIYPSDRKRIQTPALSDVHPYAKRQSPSSVAPSPSEYFDFCHINKRRSISAQNEGYNVNAWLPHNSNDIINLNQLSAFRQNVQNSPQITQVPRVNPLYFEYEADLINVYFQNLFKHAPILSKSHFLKQFSASSRSHQVLVASLYSFVSHRCLASDQISLITPEQATSFLIYGLNNTKSFNEFKQFYLNLEITDALNYAQSFIFLSLTQAVRGSLQFAVKFLMEAIEIAKGCDIDQFSNKKQFSRDLIIVECCRRTWWMCFILDRIYALIGRNAFIMDDSDLNVLLPDNDSTMLSENPFALTLPEITLQNYSDTKVYLSGMSSDIIGLYLLGQLYSKYLSGRQNIMLNYGQNHVSQEYNRIMSESQEILDNLISPDGNFFSFSNHLVQVMSYCPSLLSLDMNEIAQEKHENLVFALRKVSEIDGHLNLKICDSLLGGVALFFSCLLHVTFICLTDDLNQALQLKPYFDLELIQLENVSGQFGILQKLFKAIDSLCSRQDIKDRLQTIDNSTHLLQTGTLNDDDLEQLVLSLGSDFEQVGHYLAQNNPFDHFANQFGLEL